VIGIAERQAIVPQQKIFVDPEHVVERQVLDGLRTIGDFYRDLGV